VCCILLHSCLAFNQMNLITHKSVVQNKIVFGIKTSSLEYQWYLDLGKYIMDVFFPIYMEIICCVWVLVLLKCLLPISSLLSLSRIQLG
ncbi:hypothetical protein ACJX0J_028280, partial [Zea mays]